MADGREGAVGLTMSLMHGRQGIIEIETSRLHSNIRNVFVL